MSQGGDDDNVAAVDGQGFCANDKDDLAFLDDKDFFVGMAMERGTVPGLGMNQEEGGSNISVVPAFKTIRSAIDLNFAQGDDWMHAFFLSDSLPDS